MTDLFLLLLDYSDLIIPYILSIFDIFLLVTWFFVVRKYHITYFTSIKISLILIALSALTLPIPVNEISAILAQFAFIFLGLGICQYILEIWHSSK